METVKYSTDNEIIDTNSIINAICRVDDNIIHLTMNKSEYSKLSDRYGVDRFGKNAMLGCAYLHFHADQALNKKMRQAAELELRGEAFAEFIEGSFDYEKYGAIFKHNVIMKCGSVLNSYNWLYEIKTPNGRVYFQTNPDPQDPVITVFTSHFFDRFAMRTGIASNMVEARSKRKDAVLEYMSSKLAINDDKVMQHDGNIGIGTEKGLCLGIKKDKFILIKTFVSTDMMRGKQSILAEETSIPLFDQYNKMLEKQLNDRKYEFDKFGTVTKKQRNVGRNEPCPCGSGNKYKKCCNTIN